MKEIPFRQIHLDFHTSEKIDNIGKSFTKEKFQAMLKRGHINSINIFAKCHHGWAYHNAKVNEQHPGLQFDLLKEMIDACHEIGVRCPIYVSAGLDEKMTRRHPEWLFRCKSEETTWSRNFLQPGYHELCMNSPYLDYLVEQVKEVLTNYDCDGLWLDIVGERVCYCQNCVKKALDRGEDPRDDEVMRRIGQETFKNYAEKINDAANSIIPNLPIFHNSGHIAKGRRDLMDINSHLELESLPTGGWGYDHFPLSARYVQNSGKEYLGMTGKFHTTWGEFGGFKHPNALRYETSLCLAMGAKCSIGDQMHPLGELEETTYDIIGKAYSEVEQKESWCVGTTNKAQIAFVSVEAAYSFGNADKKLTDEQIKNCDFGALRILQEGQYLFDIIDSEMDFSKYKVIILPDEIKLDGDLKVKLDNYTLSGGKIIATGNAGLMINEDKFGIDYGIEYKGKCKYTPSYCRTTFDLADLKKTAFVMYSESNEFNVISKDTKILAYNESPYFNRDVFSFSSHQHTPNNPDEKVEGIVENENGIYVPWKVFSDYSTIGEITSKQIMIYLIDKLLGEDKAIKTNLPVPTIVTLREQKQQQRDILHMLYGSPIKRGNVEVIESIPVLSEINITLKTQKKVKELYEAVTLLKIEFTQEEDILSFKVDKLDCHKMIVVQY